MNEVGRRMPRKPFRLSAGNGHYIYIGIAAVLRAEGDRFLVRREVRPCFLTWKAGKTLCAATCFRYDPKIVSIAEDDLRRADVGLTEETGLCKRK